MDIALCYESVLPARGGSETYITSLARRLAADGHQVHLYACRWDMALLPPTIHIHRIPEIHGPRFLRPWRFGAACERALAEARHDVSMGFDKTWAQDVLYPQGGLHAASVQHNLLKYRHSLMRGLARLAKGMDWARWSFARLERRQYLGPNRPLVIAISHMVRHHFQQYYCIDSADLRVVRCAIDTGRFPEHDRPRRRLEWRQRWQIDPHDTVGLFVAMNYRLKGLEPLLHAVALLPARPPFRLLVAGNPVTQAYERLARRLGISDRVRFIGPTREVHSCYFAADFLVHPTFYDPCSLVVLEALACGLPVITSRYNGASEVLTPPREGYVIDDPHDHAHLAACMTELLDPDRRAACGQAARRTGAQWTFEHHYRQLVEVLAEAIARKHAA
jgi:UDP-glucose:(heptosyl)LPS alpha-1,3-glucosyltransferase